MKLGILVVLVFSAVIAGCLAWKPIKITWYGHKLESGQPRERLAVILKLLAMGEDGKEVVNKYMIGRTENWVKEKLGWQEDGLPVVTSNIDRLLRNMRGGPVDLEDEITADEMLAITRELPQKVTWHYKKFGVLFEKGKVIEARLMDEEELELLELHQDVRDIVNALESPKRVITPPRMRKAKKQKNLDSGLLPNDNNK
ncbi:MAG: hypothetical protein E3J72_07390 [Planctomycetota bacterium]|nr:MAG: hypothetical protein E3J72_07390 [Planctomycetota bacterium]